MEIQAIKHRFGIIGTSPLLDRCIDIARQVAPTDLTVLITGESGVGKEVFPKIIHQLSARKHGPYIAVNCGAIPEGTIDSELFGHEKGSFTGAHESRKGYFEEVNGGTIFLDEVAELPLATQVRLLRVLESGEFMRVGSSKILKTNVRVVAATNVNILDAIERGKFREDLYYRLNTVPIFVPPLRERKEDIHLIFRKFANDFAEKYRMPVVQLNDEAVRLLTGYRWHGNVRQLKNITEQISIIEQDHSVTAQVLLKYLPQIENRDLPVLYRKDNDKNEISERDLLYQVLFDMKKDIHDLKKIVAEIIRHSDSGISLPQDHDADRILQKDDPAQFMIHPVKHEILEPVEDPEIITESLSIQEREVDLIRKALSKYMGKRKNAAKELGISERTLYRKIREYNLDQ